MGNWKPFRGRVLLGVLLVVVLQTPVWASDILLDDYKSGLSPKWREKCLAGKTSYKVVQEDGQPYIKATSSSAASALYYKIEYDAKEYPIITWRWKVANVLTKGNALEKKGHDFAARVMVIFPATVPWKSQALSYAWANTLPVGSVAPNPYVASANMIRSAHVTQQLVRRRQRSKPDRRARSSDARFEKDAFVMKGGDRC